MSNSQVTGKKRKLLRRNLKRLIERIEEGIAPLQIAEVLAFGSFLRIKANPGDIDLLVFYRKDLELERKIEEFQQFILDKSKDEKGHELLKNLYNDQSLATELRARVELMPINSSCETGITIASDPIIESVVFLIKSCVNRAFEKEYIIKILYLIQYN